MTAHNFKEVTIEDIEADPHKFGAPSFEEFCADPDRYRMRKDHLLAISDNGPQLEGLKKRLGKRRWEMDGYEFRCLEHVQNYCNSEGLDIEHDIEIQPYLREGSGGKIDLITKFVRTQGVNGASTKGIIKG